MSPEPVSRSAPARSAERDERRDALLDRYDVPGPRYTSYPTVPCWDPAAFSEEAWRSALARAVSEQRRGAEVALYVHLPFCESLCTFCGCTKRITRNHAVEEPYVETLLEEWAREREHLGTDPAISEIHLGGGTPTFFSADRLARLVEGLLARARLAEDHELGFEAHPNTVTERHLLELHRIGFRRLSLGVQDFDPEVQRSINRVQTFERVRDVTAAARATGFTSIGFDLVYGLPRQTESAVADTMEKVITLRPDRIAFYGYAHVPWIRGVGQRRFSEADLPRGAAKRRLYERGRSMLEAAGYREIGMDHFALAHDSLYAAMLDGTLNRNFMGYTTTRSPIVIGLGASAISDALYAFAQNEKKVEDWRDALAARGAARWRGHCLDAEDVRLRRHILDLMCRLETRWTDADREDGLAERVSERLAGMAADGLVRVDDAGVGITGEGRAFMRNACMAFDERLARSRGATPGFSRTI